MFDLGLSDAELAGYAVRIGADVPYCIKGGTALAEGIGEKLTFLPAAPKCFILLAKPDVDVSTKFVYTNLKANELRHHPDIDSQIGLMHTLFTLEDVYGLAVSEADGEVCLKVNKDKGKEAYELLQMLHAWKEQADKLSAGEISKDDYDRWRYYYPKYDTTQLWAKVPSQELSDTLVEAFQDKLKKDE